MSVLPVKESKNAADYPKATHVLKSENGEFFWDYGKDGWYALGKVTDNVEVTYEPGLQIFSYPFDNTLKQSKDIKTTHFFVPSKTEEPWQDKIEVEGVSFSSLAPPTKIVMYPNPADNIVYLSDKTELVLVYDNKGSLVLNCSETDRIDISKIENGFYTVKLSNGTYQCTQKLFKY